MKTHKIIINHRRHTLDELVYHFEAESQLGALIRYVEYDSREDIKVVTIDSVGTSHNVVINHKRHKEDETKYEFTADNQLLAFIKFIEHISNGDVKVASITTLDN